MWGIVGGAALTAAGTVVADGFIAGAGIAAGIAAGPFWSLLSSPVQQLLPAPLYPKLSRTLTMDLPLLPSAVLAPVSFSNQVIDL